MANPALAARNRAQAIWSGATVQERGRKWIRHQHPTNPSRFMLDTHVGAIHYGVGEDQEIDTAWQPTAGAWQWEMTQADYQAYARDTFNAGDIFEFHSDGEWVRFDPQSINWIDQDTSRQQIAIKQAITGQVSDNVLSFPAAYGSGRHFEYQNGTTRLNKVITIDADTDLPAPTVGPTVWFEAEFAIAHSSGIEVYLDGALWTKVNGVRVQTADRIEFRDAATGTQVLWWLGYPSARDSAGESIVGQMEVRRQGGPSQLFICVRIPKSWIDSATFPIYIDPTIDKDIAAEADDGTTRSGNSTISDTLIIMGFNTTASIQYRDVWLRYTGISGLQNANITTSYIYIDITTSNLNIRKKLRCEKVAAPAAPTDYADFAGKTLTTAGVDYDGQAADGNSPSLNTIIQEIADNFDPSAIQIISEDDSQGTGTTEQQNMADYGSAVYTPLHIEYSSEPTPSASDSAGVSDSPKMALVSLISVTPANPSYWKQGVRIVG